MHADTMTFPQTQDSGLMTRLGASLQRGWKLYKLNRQLMAIYNAKHHLSDHAMFQDRIEDLKRQIASI